MKRRWRDQFDHFDLIAPRQHLQTHRVECDSNQREREQSTENRDHQAAEPQRRVQPLRPCRVELHVRDARPLLDLFAQRFEPLWRTVPGVDDEGIGRRILRQTLDATSASPLDCFTSCKAWSRDTKRKR
jgi:hypothetical protein